MRAALRSSWLTALTVALALLRPQPALATPTVTLTSPAGGSAIRGIVTMSADASDLSGISHVDFFRQTAPGNFTFVSVGSATSPPYQTLLNTIGLPDGDYNIRATAYANDTTNFSSGTVVTFDNTTPTASLSGPLNGAVLSGTVVLAGSQSDPPSGTSGGVASWAFEVSPHNAGSWSIVNSGTGGSSETAGWDTTQIANGSYDLRLKVVDTAGNVGISNIVTDVQVDNSNPQDVLKVDGGSVSLDPASSFAEQIMYATCAKLVNYPDEAGQQGLADLQPEVATAMPAVSADGKTYVFTLSSNWKFSDGSDLTPQSFINAIQRDLSPFGTGKGLFRDIAGAQAFINGTSPTISGLSAAGNQLTIQLNNPDSTLLPKLALSFGCAVPSSAPASHVDSLPSAGPYYVASYVPNVQLVLDVNPHYAGSRPHAFAQIVYKLGQTPASAESDVLGGQADYSAVGVPSSDFASLETTYGAGANPQRFFSNPTLALRSIVFNTSRPIFTAASVRRAVASAVDRQGLAAAFPGSSLTDQLLPPGMPGFQDATIYPYNVTDFTAAKAVVRNAGFGGATVVVYTCSSQVCQNQTGALQLTLSRVGLVADIHYLSTAAVIAALNDPNAPVDMATFGWVADYADPFDFLNSLMDPTVAGFDPSHFNDPAANSEMEAAAGLSPPSRYSQYAQVDLDLSQTYAPMTGYATINAHDFFSGRVGCQTFNPLSGMDLAALCLASQFTSSVGLSADASSAPAGAAAVPLANIPASAVRGIESGPAAAPLGGIPLGGIPLAGIPLAGIPLGGIPLAGIGLNATNLTQNALGGLPLIDVPLKARRWEDRLAGTVLANVPIQTLTLAQVLQSAPAAVTGMTLADVDLASSPLGGIPLAGIALGGIPLGGIPIGGHTDVTTNLADWCAIINAQPGYSCPSPTSLSTQSVIGLALQGIPLGGIGLDSVPLGGIDLTGSPLGGIPLGGIQLATTPLGGIPLGGIDMTVSPLGGIPLGGIPLAARTAILNCPSGTFTCPDTATLAQASAAGAVRPNATLADLDYYGAATLATIARGLPNDFTLGELLATLVATTPTDWEALPIANFPAVDYASEGGVVAYSAPFAVTGTGSTPQTVTLTATLTDGERYVAGSSDVNGSPVGDPTASASGGLETVTWTVSGVMVNTQSTLHFRAHAGLALGTAHAQIELKVASLAPVDSAPVPLNVTDTFEPNDSPAAPHPLTTGALFFSYITSATDRDNYSIPIPPAGTMTRILLSHLPADYDLVVFGPAHQPLRATPSDTIPLDAATVGDTSPTLRERSQDLTPETLADVPTTPPSGDVVVGSSDVRGTGDEEVDLVSTGQSGSYTIQVTGFNGAFSPDSYMLRIENDSALRLPPCAPRSMGSGGTAGAMPSIPAGINTLFLVNEKQFGDLNGAAAESSVVTALTTLAGRSDLGVVGAVIPVESTPNVASAYSAWNADPCSSAKANDVVRGIGSVIDTIRTGHPSIQNMVLVGGDDEIPMARVVDSTTQVNEVGYTSTFGFATNNEFVSSFGSHMLMTDDPYATTNPVTSLGQQQYVPTWGVGRLVDTPTEILNQINQFIANKGRLDPKTELTTGYDFLSDGAQAIANEWHSQGKTGSDLITPPGTTQWTRDNLIAAMFPSMGTPPAFMSINAHYDHNRLLPADQNAANKQDVLYTAAMLAAQGPNALQGRFWMTMGCHSGLNTPDTLFGPGNPIANDWPQTVDAAGAIGFMGNTGYGLGDTVTVAYSELLDGNFGRNLDGSLSIGQALSFAKQEYFGSAEALTNYDLKVINEATLYGLPMWTVGSGTPPAPPPPPPTFKDPSTGLAATEISTSPTFTPADTQYGRYYTIGGRFAAVNRRPIEPATSFDVTEPNLVPHGAVVTALSSTDEPIDAAFSRAVADSAQQQPELVGQITFPTQLQQLRSIATPNGQRQRLVLTMGQYRSDATPDPLGNGTQRKFTSATVRVLYASSSVTDFTAPTIGLVSLGRIGSNVAFSANVRDSDSPVVRVLALYLDGGVWRSTDLALNAGVWSGAGPVAQTSVQYYLEAVDSNGNVAVTSDKGSIAPVVVPTSTGSVHASLSGVKNGDWYTGPVSVTLAGGSGVAIQDSVDGSAFENYSAPFAVSGDGVHIVRFTGDDGSSGEVDFSIDTTVPKIAFGDRSYGLGSTGNVFDFTCSDAGSGIAACTATPGAPDTSSIGAKTFNVRAVDRVGNAADGTGQYHVFWPFRGFFQPLSNPPFLNVINAGSAVPVKFSLNGNRGLAIFAENSPQSTKIACDAVAPLDTTITTANVGSSSLTYDPTTDTYTYGWKTDKAWAGTCRRLSIGLADGSTHLLNFKLK